MEDEKILGMIPARYGSSRFPGKPLALLQGKPLIQRVYEQAQKASALSKLVVATDDQRIFQAVESFGGSVRMTSDQHVSGTDRCAEVAAYFPQYTYVVNIQGDEPFIDPAQINLLGTLLRKGADIATLGHRVGSANTWNNPNVVKVVRNQGGAALYFSRAPIPYARGRTFEEIQTDNMVLHHIGIYGFRREILLEVARLEVSPLEQAESLEQLRWMDSGYQIQVGESPHFSVGIDTPEDLIQANLKWPPA